MKIKTCVGCLVVLLFCGMVGAQAAPSWAHVGQWYTVTVPKAIPLLPDGIGYSDESYSLINVKIVEVGNAEWARVEYNDRTSAADVKPAVIERRRAWVNFAYVVNAVLRTEPDLKLAYPGGFTLVPFKGTNK